MKLLTAMLLATALGLSNAHAQQAIAPIPPPSGPPTPSATAQLPPVPALPPVPPVPDAAAPTDPIAAPVAAYVPPIRHRRLHVVAQGSSSAGERSETQALNILEAQGDGDFSDLHRTGRDYTATVNQNGAAQTVVVNPRTGEIRNTQ